jgi:t-SNARE complex subunit (syntaxin)
MGFIGYHSYNRPRPKSVYHTEIRVVDFKGRRRSSRRSARSTSPSDGYESAYKKIKESSKKVQREAADAESKIAKMLTQINEKNIEAQKSMMKAFNDQKARLEEQISKER